jgi:hypothetical protein
MIKWLSNLKLLFKWKDLVYGEQERRIKDIPRPGTIPWDETYERRTKPHTYEEISNG